MTNSLRFRQLKSELRRLRIHLLPKNWDPTGTYSDRKIDRTRSYRILVHAEIESFLEDILLNLIDDKFDQWKTSKKSSYVIVCLLAASKNAWMDHETEELGLTPVKPPKLDHKDESINEFIKRAIDQYKEILTENHGIMKKDLKRMLLPVGLSLADLDQTWLNDMNSFGGKRGEFAHKSRLGIRNLPDPRSEKEAVDGLISGLKELDGFVLQIKGND